MGGIPPKGIPLSRYPGQSIPNLKVSPVGSIPFRMRAVLRRAAPPGNLAAASTGRGCRRCLFASIETDCGPRSPPVQTTGAPQRRASRQVKGAHFPPTPLAPLGTGDLSAVSEEATVAATAATVSTAVHERQRAVQPGDLADCPRGGAFANLALQNMKGSPKPESESFL